MMLKKLGLLFISILLINGCDHSGGEPVRLNSYAHIGAEPIRVARYEFVPFEPGTQTLKPDSFMFSPEETIETFFVDRFDAQGEEGVLRFIVQSITVDHRVVVSDNTLSQALGVGKQDHYLIRARVRLELSGSQQLEEGFVTLNAQQNVYISEHSSPFDRERQQARGVETLIDDLDNTVQKVLGSTFFIL